MKNKKLEAKLRDRPEVQAQLADAAKAKKAAMARAKREARKKNFETPWAGQNARVVPRLPVGTGPISLKGAGKMKTEERPRVCPPPCKKNSYELAEYRENMKTLRGALGKLTELELSILREYLYVHGHIPQKWMIGK